MPEPKKNTAFVFDIGLPSQANGAIFQVNPTLAAGDVKVSKDNGALANLATLPVVTPAGSKIVKVSLSANEMNADRVTVQFSDAAGSEWGDILYEIHTTTLTIDDPLTVGLVDEDAINEDSIEDGAITDAAFRVPDEETSRATGFMGRVNQMWRRAMNKQTMTSSQQKTYKDDGTTVATTQTVADDGTTQTRGAAP